MKKLIAGNWKMNATLEQSTILVSSIIEMIKENPSVKDNCDFLICPPSMYFLNIVDICVKDNISIGSQDCSIHKSGAYTGDISASMVADCDGQYVIIGHSERRNYHNETCDIVAKKAKATHDAELIAIICVGETQVQREAGQEQEIVAKQIIDSLPDTANYKNTVIAYEPVWAIGTGKTATPDDVRVMHSFIRSHLKAFIDDSDKMRILYGGSMKPDNARDLLSIPNVDGGLIGGASLNAKQFVEIGLATC